MADGGNANPLPGTSGSLRDNRYAEPWDMTDDEQMAEVAAILASGYRRTLALQAGREPFTEKPLDSSGTPRPLCVEGLTGRDPAPEEVSE